MKSSYGEITDKYTILLIKQRNGLVVSDELEEIGKVTKDIDYDELYEINTKCWRLEEMISEERNLEKIGAYHLALLWLGHKRTTEKNRITEKYGGHTEQKKY